MQRESPSHATLFATALFVGGLVCGALAGRAAVARAQDPYAHLDLFARVLTTIQQDYVEPLPTEVLVGAAPQAVDELLHRGNLPDGASGDRQRRALPTAARWGNG